jgi:hypothetical protein
VRQHAIAALNITQQAKQIALKAMKLAAATPNNVPIRP